METRIDEKLYDLDLEKAEKDLILAFKTLQKYNVSIRGCGCCDCLWVEMGLGEYFMSLKAKEQGCKNIIYGENARDFDSSTVVVDYVKTLLKPV